ncbi:hypothetical protein Bbelb_093620 [Branchiostoma belcheri]|nr:hypothetical protein Bbelb_093620 [Branchiostoma belcheri]
MSQTYLPRREEKPPGWEFGVTLPVSHPSLPLVSIRLTARDPYGLPVLGRPGGGYPASAPHRLRLPSRPVIELSENDSPVIGNLGAVPGARRRGRDGSVLLYRGSGGPPQLFITA